MKKITIISCFNVYGSYVTLFILHSLNNFERHNNILTLGDQTKKARLIQLINLLTFVEFEGLEFL